MKKNVTNKMKWHNFADNFQEQEVKWILLLSAWFVAFKAGKKLSK